MQLVKNVMLYTIYELTTHAPTPHPLPRIRELLRVLSLSLHNHRAKKVPRASAASCQQKMVFDAFWLVFLLLLPEIHFQYLTISYCELPNHACIPPPHELIPPLPYSRPFRSGGRGVTARRPECGRKLSIFRSFQCIFTLSYFGY